MSKEKSKEKLEYKEAKAIIIGNTFTSLLEPLTIDTPYLLLPICGIPIIEIMLNCLSGIKEVIICIKEHKKQMENYLRTYHDKLNYKLVYNEDFKNVVDCLRQIKQENYITSDFILIRGLFIINSDFEELFNIHLRNKKADRNCMITSIMKKYKTTNETKTNYDENILIYNEINKRIYQFEPTYNKKKVEIFKGIISKENMDNKSIIRSDLFETGVEICSTTLLEQMTENEKFDLQSIRDYIGQILSDEIYTDTFYLHELGEDAYCGLIRNVESYLKVNFEILNRWAYPIVIDNIDLSNKLKINLKQIRYGLFSDKEANAENFNKAELFSEVVILNKENMIEKESKLKKCVLCKDVKIGEKCDLYNCIIFKGTKIENNVIIKNSIIGKNCYIKSGVKIISSVIGSNVELDKDSIQKRIYKKKGEEILEEISKELFLQNLEFQEKLFLVINSQYGFYDSHLDLKTNTTSLLDSDEFYTDEESEQSYNEETFEEGVEYIITSGTEKNKEKKDLVNEIWNLRNDKLVSNPTLEDTLNICLTIILKKFLNGNKFVKNKHSFEELTKLFNEWKPLFKKFVPDENIELNLVSVLEYICNNQVPELNSSFYILAQILNNKCELIKDETLINWYDNEESSFESNEGNVIIPKDIHEKNKKKMEKYVNDLKNTEDEEEEEEEDDNEK
jgi:NDP-sugar pyrophosphorylase family protein